MSRNKKILQLSLQKTEGAHDTVFLGEDAVYDWPFDPSSSSDTWAHRIFATGPRAKDVVDSSAKNLECRTRNDTDVACIAIHRKAIGA